MDDPGALPPGAHRAYSLDEIVALTGLSREAARARLKRRARRGLIVQANERGFDGSARWRLPADPDALRAALLGDDGADVQGTSPHAHPGRTADARRTHTPDALDADLVAAERDRLRAELQDALAGQADARVEAARLAGRVEALEAEIARLTAPGPLRRLLEALAERIRPKP